MSEKAKYRIKWRFFNLWLACWTEDEIAGEMGVGSSTVRDVLSTEKENLQKPWIFANYQDPDWSSPLEIGVHALGIKFDKRGMGAKGGGLKGYAEQIGQDSGNVTRYKNGAEVLKLINCNITINEKDILDKAAHLAAVHSLPQELWPIIVQWVITKNALILLDLVGM